MGDTILILGVHTGEMRGGRGVSGDEAPIEARRQPEQKAGELIAPDGMVAGGLHGAAAGVVGNVAEVPVLVCVGVGERRGEQAVVLTEGEGMRAPDAGEVVSNFD